MAKRRLASFAARLAHARSLVPGLACSRLSLLAGLTRTHVSAIENGKSNGRPKEVEIETARKLAAVLGVSLDWLVSGLGERPIAVDVIDSVRKATERAA